MGLLQTHQPRHLLLGKHFWLSFAIEPLTCRELVYERERLVGRHGADYFPGRERVKECHYGGEKED